MTRRGHRLSRRAGPIREQAAIYGVRIGVGWAHAFSAGRRHAFSQEDWSGKLALAIFLIRWGCVAFGPFAVRPAAGIFCGIVLLLQLVA
ncbi:MAG: hypothetical protein KatS3mg110_1626 [Pirellulaceae bacterium]|nr:MAG: hypothetical protein KatS3mg110_1626 [Pirellulaceae bacterium]